MLPGIVWNCPWFRPIFFLVIQARNNIIFESVYSVYIWQSYPEILDIRFFKKKNKCKSCLQILHVINPLGGGGGENRL